MTIPEYYPYRSEEARNSCLAFCDSWAARDWPVASEERIVPTTYGKTFVRITGPAGAPPLVLLHGAAATSLMWAPNIEALSAEYRTFAVDQVGEFGRSTCTKPLPLLADMLAWLDELFNALDFRAGLNLAGLSFGGGLAAQYALKYPARVNKVVLLAPAATVLRLRAEFLVRLSLAAMSPQTFLPRFVRWIFPDMLRKDPKWADTTLEQLFLVMRSLQPRKVPFPPVLTDTEWGSFGPPALFLAGEHEVIYSAKKAVRRLQRVAPGITALIVPGAGHDLSFAQADMVNRHILEFLKREPATSQLSRAAAS